MNIIITVDNNWAYANQGKALVQIPEDAQLIMQETVGKVVIMDSVGRERFPGGQLMDNRINIVIGDKSCYNSSNVILCDTPKQALEVAKEYSSESVYILGGKNVYDFFLPECDTVHATKINYEYQADTKLENLDASSEWIVSQRSDEHTYFDLEYEFVKYVRQ